jgi:hypothetical protein
MAVVTVLGGNDPSQTQVQFTTEAAAAAAQAVVAALNAHIQEEDQGYGFLDYDSTATVSGGAISSQSFLHGVLGDSSMARARNGCGTRRSKSPARAARRGFCPRLSMSCVSPVMRRRR